MKSFPKNIDKLSHFLFELKSYPDVIVITETKLKQDKNYLDVSHFISNTEYFISICHCMIT